MKFIAKASALMLFALMTFYAFTDNQKLPDM